MNCKIYNCQETATYPYPACSAQHGSELRSKIGLLRTYQKEGNGGFTGFGLNEFMSMSVGELEWYNKLI